MRQGPRQQLGAPSCTTECESSGLTAKAPQRDMAGEQEDAAAIADVPQHILDNEPRSLVALVEANDLACDEDVQFSVAHYLGANPFTRLALRLRTAMRYHLLADVKGEGFGPELDLALLRRVKSTAST